MKSSFNALPLIIWGLLLSSHVWSQSKLKVTQADYKKWHLLTGELISPDGNWVSYRFEYENGIDTTFVQDVHTGKKLIFPNATRVEFSPSGKCVIATSQDNTATARALNTSLSISLHNTQRYEFSRLGKYLAVLHGSQDKRRLSLLNEDLETIKELDRVRDFKIHDDGELAVYDASGITIYDSPNLNSIKVIADTDSLYKKMVWDKSGKHLAFLRAGKSTSSDKMVFDVCLYNASTKTLKILPCEQLKGLKVDDQMHTAVMLSDDGDKVFFYYTSEPGNKPKDQIVEVWDSSAKLVYPAEKVYGDAALIQKLAVWDVVTGEVSFLATDELPFSLLTTDKKYALTYSPLTYEPQYEMAAPVDLYITEVRTGNKNLLLAKQSLSPYTMGSSPCGRYLNYYKEKHWWIYDTKDGSHKCVTSDLKVSFEDEEFDHAGPADGYISPGWTSDSNYFIIYDKYDIWLISPDGKIQSRITRGREEKISYRIYLDYYRQRKKIGSADIISFTFEMSEGILLRSESHEKATGFFHWRPDRKLKEIAYGNSRVSGLRKADNAEKYIYIEETFETPPEIFYNTNDYPKVKKVVQSNAFYEKYEWGTSGLIVYKNWRGEEMQAALYYPAGFKAGKQYPMIVYIYSKLSQEVHDYRNPTMYNGGGFMLTNYTSDGYLVLMPDITYTVGSPGKSIEDCVIPAVTAVMDMGIVQKGRIGLTGHSYGGYQTCHLLTRTSIFAAAVAGAPVTDLISSYLSVNPENGRKNDWRFESQQFRMASTPFDDLEGYLANSTVTNAAKITTPLLHWFGTADQSVDWRQGIELHSALRRLQKRNVFLVYPNQGHVLSDPSMQFDITSRTKNWFDHYLKGKPYLDAEVAPAAGNGM